MKTATSLSLAAIACTMLATSHAAADDIRIRDAWLPAHGEHVRVAPVYLTLVNQGSHADRLIGVRSEIARTATLHAMTIEADQARQRPLRAVELPAGIPVPLHAGGAYVILDDIVTPLRPRAVHTLHLVFEHAGEREVKFRVRPAGRDDDTLENLRTDPLQQPGQIPRSEGLDDALRTDPFLR